MGERTTEPHDATKGGDRKAGGSDREPNGKSAERDGRDNRNAQDRDTDRKSVELKSDVDRKSAETGDRDRIDRDRKAGDRKGATAKIDTNQKQKVRAYFSEHRPSAKRIDKSDVRVSIGIGIPAAIALAPLPPDIVVVAADCPLQYFLWGNDVVLVGFYARARWSISFPTSVRGWSVGRWPEPTPRTHIEPLTFLVCRAALAPHLRG